VITNCTTGQHEGHVAVREPWLTWQDTWRYLVIRLGEVTPSVLLLWHISVHR
jgi:hypothetical protein